MIRFLILVIKTVYIYIYILPCMQVMRIETNSQHLYQKNRRAEGVEN